MPVGLSGSVSTSTPGRAPMPAASASAARSCAGSGTPPASRADRHADHALAGERRVRGVADPARDRQHDVARQRLQQREQQRLAPGREHDLARIRRQAAALEVAGRRLARGGRAGDRPVAVAARALGQPLGDRGQHRQPGLAEREMEHGLAGRELGLHALVGRQRGRLRQAPMSSARNTVSRV